MKDIGNIEDWYRNELNNYHVDPDKNGWNSLSEELDLSTPLTDDTISDWYKKEVVKLEERPDFSVWEKLATQLDTASVWGKLAVSLNRYDQLIWWRNLAIRGSAIFLLFFGSYLAYDNYLAKENSLAYHKSMSEVNNNKQNNIIVSKDLGIVVGDESNSTTSQGIGDETNSENKSFNTLNKSSNPSESVTVNGLSSQKNKVNPSVSADVKIRQAVQQAKAELRAKNVQLKKETPPKRERLYADKEQYIQSHSISKENFKRLKSSNERSLLTEINRRQLTEKDISYLMEDVDYLVKKDKDKIVFNSKRFSSYSMFGVYARRVYAGFNVGMKKQGMLTQIKEEAKLATYNQRVLLDFGSSYGGTVGYILSDNINVEANINLSSTSGFKRAYDAEGISFQENLNLNYTTINLLAKKMNNKSTFDNKVYSTNFIGGIYASYLRSAVSEINGTSRSIEQYNKMDYGIVLGIEQDRYITKTLVITPGLRYNQGIANIANSDSPFETSRNFSFEFNLGIKYIFLKKGK